MGSVNGSKLFRAKKMIPIMCRQLSHRPASNCQLSQAYAHSPQLHLVPQVDSKLGQVSQYLERQPKPKPPLSGVGKEPAACPERFWLLSLGLGRIPRLPTVCLSGFVSPPPLCSEPAAHSWRSASITLQRGASQSGYLFT